jgi:hypothetical protein
MQTEGLYIAMHEPQCLPMMRKSWLMSNACTVRLELFLAANNAIEVVVE